MATGDQTDMVERARSVLPVGWFPTTTPGQPTQSPVLDGVLNGCAACMSFAYSLLQYVITQTRILTASGVFLDMIAADFFGSFLSRRLGEGDTALQSRIQKELFRPKGSRPAMVQAITDLTGHAPWIFEPSEPQDTGGYGVACGYGVGGGYGSLLMPFQFLMKVKTPVGSGIPGVMGYGHLGSVTSATGGYGSGAIEYASRSMMGGVIGQAAVLAVVNDVRPVASTAWIALD